MKNLLEQIMKDNFPNLVKDIDFQEVQEAQKVPRKLDPKRNTPRYIIKLRKIKDKERILKAAREKERVTYKGVPYRQEGAGKKYSSHERQGPTHPNLLYPAKLSFRTGGQIQCFPDKLKEFIITKPLSYEMLKALI